MRRTEEKLRRGILTVVLHPRILMMVPHRRHPVIPRPAAHHPPPLAVIAAQEVVAATRVQIVTLNQQRNEVGAKQRKNLRKLGKKVDANS